MSLCHTGSEPRLCVCEGSGLQHCGCHASSRVPLPGQADAAAAAGLHASGGRQRCCRCSQGSSCQGRGGADCLSEIRQADTGCCVPGLPWSKRAPTIDNFMPASTSQTQTGLSFLAAAWVSSSWYLSLVQVQVLSAAKSMSQPSDFDGTVVTCLRVYQRQNGPRCNCFSLSHMQGCWTAAVPCKPPQATATCRCA